jgi:hypothetical protein
METANHFENETIRLFAAKHVPALRREIGDRIDIGDDHMAQARHKRERYDPFAEAKALGPCAVKKNKILRHCVHSI